VADRLATSSPESLFDPEIVEIANEADLFVVNLECCVSERGTRWPAPGKVFLFRAPASAAEALARLGVDCVCLANNHALDFGEEALPAAGHYFDRRSTDNRSVSSVPRPRMFVKNARQDGDVDGGVRGSGRSASWVPDGQTIGPRHHREPILEECGGDSSPPC